MDTMDTFQTPQMQWWSHWTSGEETSIATHLRSGTSWPLMSSPGTQCRLNPFHHFGGCTSWRSSNHFSTYCDNLWSNWYNLVIFVDSTVDHSKPCLSHIRSWKIKESNCWEQDQVCSATISAAERSSSWDVLERLLLGPQRTAHGKFIDGWSSWTAWTPHHLMVENGWTTTLLENRVTSAWAYIVTVHSQQV